MDMKYQHAHQFWASFHSDFYQSAARVLKEWEKIWTVKHAKKKLKACMFRLSVDYVEIIYPKCLHYLYIFRY